MEQAVQIARGENKKGLFVGRVSSHAFRIQKTGGVYRRGHDPPPTLSCDLVVSATSLNQLAKYVLGTSPSLVANS